MVRHSITRKAAQANKFSVLREKSVAFAPSPSILSQSFHERERDLFLVAGQRAVEAHDLRGLFLRRRSGSLGREPRVAYELVVISDIEYDAASGIYTVTENFSAGGLDKTFVYSATAGEWSSHYGFDDIAEIYEAEYAEAAA